MHASGSSMQSRNTYVLKSGIIGVKKSYGKCWHVRANISKSEALLLLRKKPVNTYQAVTFFHLIRMNKRRPLLAVVQNRKFKCKSVKTLVRCAICNKAFESTANQSKHLNETPPYILHYVGFGKCSNRAAFSRSFDHRQMYVIEH